MTEPRVAKDRVPAKFVVTDPPESATPGRVHWADSPLGTVVPVMSHT